MSHEERSVYSTETGLFTGVIIAVHDDLLDANTPSGHAALIGRYDNLSQRVDIASGEVIDYQPPAPSADHEWNADTKRWQLAAAAQSKIDNHNAAMTGIARLEAAQHRAVRELALGRPAAAERLMAIDAEIVSLRSQL